MAYVVPSPNVLLDRDEDKQGHIFIELKNRLVASGLWRVRGSGDNSTFQLMGQTAGVAGSFDVFTAAKPWVTSPSGWWYGAVGTMSRTSAWYVLEEIASGRCLSVQRYSAGGNYSSDNTIHFSTGVASAGASPTAMPARTAPSAQVNGYLGTDLTTAAHQNWLQIGLSDQNVGMCAPFYATVVNRSNGARSWSMIYETLIDTVPGDTHPFIIGAGDVCVSDAFYNNARYAGGSDFGNRRLCKITFYSPAFPGSAQQLGTDGKWRTHRPWVHDYSNNALVGRCQHLFINSVYRDYPATYGAGTPNAKVAVSQFLLPWTPNAAPEYTP